jgi:hypothetical protein
MGKKLGERLVSPSAFRAWIDIGPERVRQLAAEGVLRRAEKGKYPLQPNILAYVLWLRDEQRKAHQGAAREEVERERARKLKNENDETERLLMRTEDAIAAVDAIVGPIKADLAGVPVRATDDILLRRKIEDAIDSVLAGLAARFEKAGADLRAGRDALEADAEDDTDGVGED